MPCVPRSMTRLSPPVCRSRWYRRDSAWRCWKTSRARLRIARCETGGNWQMVGPRYSGGVGFANTTWDGFGGREFAPMAGYATREQQIIVAERVYARYGLSGWGCRAYG